MSGYGLITPVIDQLENWTVEEAVQAQREWNKTHRGARFEGPIFQWTAWHEDLPKLRQRYEEGDSSGLIRAIEVCALHKLPMPEWCSYGYLKSWRKAKSSKVRTLDEAFGYSMKGKNLKDAQQRYKLQIPVAIEVAILLGDGETLENALLSVAEKYPVSTRLASDWFYTLRGHPAVSVYLPTKFKNSCKE